MYSVVLMAALTTSVDLPDRGHRGGGCCGCYGGGYGGCYGGGYGGCYGGGYGGGWGGCYGGGWGGGYGGCMGMGYGGGCMGMGYGGGCMGMGYGGGCMGAGYGGGFGYGGGIIMPGTGTGTGTGGEKLKNPPKGKGGDTMAPANAATIVVDLPADAKLLIGGEATTSTGNSRVFYSPELKPGKEYQYTLTAEIVRDGKPVKSEQVVKVSAGTVTPVTITLPAAGVAQR